MNTLLECVISHTQDWLMLDMTGYQWHRTMTIPANPEINGSAEYDTTRVVLVVGNELQSFDIDTSFDDVTKFVKTLRNQK